MIQEILGHSSIKITMDTYSHVIPGMQEEAAERLQRLLFGSTPVTLPSEGENAEKNARADKKNPLFAEELEASSAGLESTTFRFVVRLHVFPSVHYGLRFVLSKPLLQTLRFSPFADVGPGNCQTSCQD